MSDNKIDPETPQFHPWEVLIPELRLHALSFCDKSSLFNYAQCAKIPSEEIQMFDTKTPVSVEVKDLRNSKMGVIVKLNYKKEAKSMDDQYISINIDSIEALIESYARDGNVEAAETARRELAALRAEELQRSSEFCEKLTRIAARLVNVVEDQRPHAEFEAPDRLIEWVNLDRFVMEEFDNVDLPDDDDFRFENEFRFEQEVQRKVARELRERGIGRKELGERRAARERREASERRIELSFVAVGPNHHKMLLNRPSTVEALILDGNAVDAAYDYVAKRFDNKKNGKTEEIRLDVKKWPTQLMESRIIQKGVAKWEVTMYRTIYEEFMQHMRMDTNEKDITIHPGYGMGYKFKLPSEIFTIFRDGDGAAVKASCHLSDEEILQTECKWLSFPADAITDIGIHALIRKVISSTDVINLWIWRSRKVCKGRQKLNLEVILGDLPVVNAGFWTPLKLLCADGRVCEIGMNTGECRITIGTQQPSLIRRRHW